MLLTIPEITLITVIEIVILACAGATVSITVTKSKIFEWLRDFLESHAPEKIYELFSCPYCFGHWAAALIVVIVQPVYVVTEISYVLDLTISWLALTALTSYAGGLILKSYK